MADTIKRSSLLTALVDPLQPTTDRAERPYRFTGGRLTWMAPLLVGVALLVVSLVGWAVGASQQFYFSYLVGWSFCLSLALGALFIVIIKHLTKAYWVVAVRRIPEALVWSFPLLILLFIPLLFGVFDHEHGLYEWAHEGGQEEVAAAAHGEGGEALTEAQIANEAKQEALVAKKKVYLNTPFFLIRLAFYFFVWTTVAYKLYTLSVRQDVDPDPEIPAKQRRVSAWALPLTGVTTAFASFDLLMSLDPHWYSTIFGVYFFGGAFLAALSFVAFAGMVLQRQGGMLRNVVTVEHYHDLGKLMFGFVVFWTYIAFSQYMLVWYGNIPEETVWFRHRLEHGWAPHSAALLFLHFIVPFVVLLPRATKRSMPVLGVMAVWLLIMHWFDLHWLAMPALPGNHAGFHVLDFSCWLGLTGVFVGVFVWRLSRHALVPQNDPLLPKSLRFENA